MARAAFLLCALVVACSAPEADRVAAARPVAIGPAWVADPPVPAPMTGEQFGAGVGFDGTNHLVGWIDLRARYGAAILTPVALSGSRGPHWRSRAHRAFTWSGCRWWTSTATRSTTGSIPR